MRLQPVGGVVAGGEPAQVRRAHQPPRVQGVVGELRRQLVVDHGGVAVGAQRRQAGEPYGLVAVCLHPRLRQRLDQVPPQQHEGLPGRPLGPPAVGHPELGADAAAPQQRLDPLVVGDQQVHRVGDRQVLGQIAGG